MTAGYLMGQELLLTPVMAAIACMHANTEHHSMAIPAAACMHTHSNANNCYGKGYTCLLPDAAATANNN